MNPLNRRTHSFIPYMFPSILLLLFIPSARSQDFLGLVQPFINGGLGALGGAGGGGTANSGQGFLGSFAPFVSQVSQASQSPAFQPFLQFIRPQGPVQQPPPSGAVLPSARDYDDVIVPSHTGQRSRTVHTWRPVVPQQPQNRAPPINRNIAPRVKPTQADYDDDIDLTLTGARPSRGVRVVRTLGQLQDPVPHSSVIRALRVKNPDHNNKMTSAEFEGVPNIVSEISALSTVHQTPNGDYASVEKIMKAFNEIFTDPNKSKRVQMDDLTEVGMNKEVSSHLFQSDIVLTLPQIKSIVISENEKREGRRRFKRKVITGEVYRWPSDRPIPYRMKHTDPKWKKMVIEAMQLWENETCVRFQENYGAQDHILFYKGSGCFSSVGKTGGSQMISVGPGCDNLGIIAHEIAHALGFWHEQSRPDRDYFIKIRNEFVASGAESNFLKQTIQETDSMGLPYDMGSIMHYGPEAFSSRVDEITIETLDSRYESTIGQRTKPSFIDIKQLNRLYCNDACRGMQLACRHGGYPNPRNCQICTCPDGLTGDICSEVDTGECSGSELLAGRGWQEIRHSGRGNCGWRIKVKNGKIRMRLSNVNMICQRTCSTYVEIKSGLDYQQTGFRACCEDDVSIVSEGDEVLVFVRSASHRLNSFTLHYVKVDSLTEKLTEVEESTHKAPTIRPWVPGQENRAFRGIDDGPVEQFILNSLSGMKSMRRDLSFNPLFNRKYHPFGLASKDSTNFSH